MQQNQTGKTKTAMLLELESIKDLLVEEDGIPILQEVVLPIATPESASPVTDLPATETQASATTPAKTPDHASASQSSNHNSSNAGEISFEAKNDREINQQNSPESENSGTAAAVVTTRLHPMPTLFTIEQDEAIAAASTQDTSVPAPANPSVATTAPAGNPVYREEQQQDFFPLSMEEDAGISSTELSSTELSSTETSSTELSPPEASSSEASAESLTASTFDTTPSVALAEKLARQQQRPATASPGKPAAKASGQNPFLPEHIRARLQGNNPASFALENTKNFARKHLTAFSAQTKTTSAQQQLIDDMVDKLLPVLERELRSHLAAMSKGMLENLLDEKK